MRPKNAFIVKRPLEVAASLETILRFHRARLKLDFAKMPKSFLVKKRVVITACKESQDLSDAEIKHEPGKVLAI